MLHELSALLALIALLAGTASAQTWPATFLNGIDANYALDLAAKGRTFAAADGKAPDPFAILAAAGCDSFRVRLWTGNDGVNGLNYAAETAKRAQRAGMKPYLVLFLSEDWADMVKQPVPAVWKDLDEAAKFAAITAYADRVTRRFAAAGVEIDLYEIGNEIDFGICGVFEEEWPRRVSLDYMRQRIWPRMVPILKAAQDGVRRSRPDAKFMLHLARWNEPDYGVAFWQYMLANGVAVDHPGLSYFPTSAKTEENGLLQFAGKVAAVYDAMKRPVIVCEYAYPSSATFTGQFADWNKPVAGYTLDEAGQAKWVADFLAMARSSPHLAGAFYWSPEWNDQNMWDAFALFDEKGQTRPAVRSLGR